MDENSNGVKHSVRTECGVPNAAVEQAGAAGAKRDGMAGWWIERADEVLYLLHQQS